MARLEHLYWIGVAFLINGCQGSPASSVQPAASATTRVDPADQELAAVSAIHGGTGPWAVAGYRMGKFALAKLGLQRQSFDLEIEHRSPREVQYSCIADGAAAATGASLGKLNLTLIESDRPHLATTYRRKSTGQSLTLRPSASFVDRFSNVPVEKLAAEGRIVLGLSDNAVFEEVR